MALTLPTRCALLALLATPAAAEGPSLAGIAAPMLDGRTPTMASARHLSYQIGEVSLRLERLASAEADTRYETVAAGIDPLYSRDFAEARVVAGPLLAGPAGRYLFQITAGAEAVVIWLTAPSQGGQPSEAAADIIGRIACSTTFEGRGLPCALD